MSEVTEPPGHRKKRRHFKPRKAPDPRPPAQAPGLLVYTGERRVADVTFRVVDYGADGIREMDSTSVPDCVEFEGRDSPTWIITTGLHDVQKIGELLAAYEIHPLVQEDILNTRQ